MTSFLETGLNIILKIFYRVQRSSVSLGVVGESDHAQILKLVSARANTKTGSIIIAITVLKLFFSNHYLAVM
jgi:hypothetical protein